MPRPSFQPSTLAPFLLPAPAQGGLVVVNGVVASAHSDWVLDDLVPAAWTPALPRLYQALFRPVYWAYRLLGPRAMEAWNPPQGLANLAGQALVPAGVAAAVVGAALAAANARKPKQA